MLCKEGESVMDRPTEAVKYKIIKIDKPCFFLKPGAIVIIDRNNGRIYSEDRTEYMPLDTALKMGFVAVHEKEKKQVNYQSELKDTIELEGKWEQLLP